MPKPPPCPNPCNVLLVGGGGREHALALRLRQSPRLGQLWLTDGANAGLRSLGRVMDEPFELKNPFRISRWCDRHDIHFIVVGPEAPLAAGIVDGLETPKRLVFGPNKAAAQIEADKAFAKQLMRTAGVPTGEARVFDNPDHARAYIESRDEPLVVKASGLAAGKGVVVCSDPIEALAALDELTDPAKFGSAGDTIIVEEKLSGQEVSILALTDGKTIWVLDSCQDHKQVGEGDTGPNTGGMGAYSPTDLLDEALLDQIESQILVPTVDALRRDGIRYRGVLYAGLMLTPAGPKVLEFNCRFGDPETQALMPRLKGDLLDILWRTAAGSLGDAEIAFDDRTACCVVLTAGGYPGAYEKGHVIHGLEDAAAMTDVTIFHAGTTLNTKNEIITNGGRVLGVTALGDDLRAARDLANAACGKISFPGCFHRRDIGSRVLSAAPVLPASP